MVEASQPAIAALAALSDPTRRRIFERLSTGPAPVGVIANGLPVTRPAVSQHLRVLKEAGLVFDRSEGTKRIYQIDPRGIALIRGWLDAHWGNALESFQAFANASKENDEK